MAGGTGFPKNSDWDIVSGTTISGVNAPVSFPKTVVQDGRGVLLVAPSTNKGDITYGPPGKSSGSPLVIGSGKRETLTLFIRNLDQIEYQSALASAVGTDKLFAILEIPKN